jgi:cysteine desulfurase
MKVYLDNAATTPLAPEVLEAMLPYMETHFGNPSSIHSFGRETRSAIEKARKQIADLLFCSPSEIFFTSGGTEANNMALKSTIASKNIQQVISSKIEHHAVLHTLETLEKNGQIKLSFVDLDEQGFVKLDSLETLLKANPKSLVSLMHANNEISNLLDIEKVGELCKQYNALFHSDCVQTVGHHQLTLSELNVNLISCSAHKFHGPKGVGFIYIEGGLGIQSFISGGSQERNMRGGTENVYGIVGLAKAMELAYANLEVDRTYVQNLKDYTISSLKNTFDDIYFNGAYKDNSNYTVLNVSLPPSNNSEMMLFNLDIAGVAVSGGSACTSGSMAGSHVLDAIGADPNRPAIRISFSKFNTKKEIDFCIDAIKKVYH